MKKIFIYTLLVLTLSFVFTSCSNDSEITEESTAVTGVSLSSSSISLGIGDTKTLTATIEPSDAANTDVTWGSSDTLIATVDEGVVTGVAEGTATITVTTDDGGYTATCTVSVTEDGSGSALSDGYVLYSFLNSYNTYLIDTSGTAVKTWTSSHQAAGASYLSSNLTLLRGGLSSSVSSSAFANGGGVTGVIEELDDNSNVLWSFESATDDATLHHDFKEIDENTIIALMWKVVTYDSKEYWNDNIVIIDKTTNTITWEWSALDDGGITPSGSSEDYIHFNSVFYNEDNDEILVSSYEKSTLYVIDKESKEILSTYTAGGTLSNQHDATFLDNGNILVFNNKASSNASAVYEIDENDNVVWEYSDDFYSGNISGAQRLSGGNTIICSGTESRFIEVTSDGEVVWDYTPSNGSSQYGIFKIRKYTEY